VNRDSFKAQAWNHSDIARGLWREEGQKGRGVTSSFYCSFNAWTLFFHNGVGMVLSCSKCLGTGCHGGWEPRNLQRFLNKSYILGHRQNKETGLHRVGLLESAALSGWYTSSKAKYRDTRPIANKYREGKMQRTLKRELKSAWNRWKGSRWNNTRNQRWIEFLPSARACENLLVSLGGD